MKLGFKKIDLDKERNIVTIIVEGDITVKMSILQLAKIWGTDKKIVQETENDWGSVELEERCEETRNSIKQFPKINLKYNEIKFENDKISKKIKDKSIFIYCEDISGWNNEGIRIDFPKKRYDTEVGERKFDLVLNPTDIEFKIGVIE